MSKTPTPSQLMQVIRIQTEISKIGIDLGGIMQYVVEQVLDLIGATGAAIELAEGEDMVYRAASGIAKDQLGLRLKISESMSGLCVRTGEVLYCTDSDTDARVNREACKKIGLRSMIVIPLKHNETPVGVLKAMGTEPEAFTTSAITLLGLLSEVIAASMFFSAKYDSDALFIKATHDSMTGLANRALFMDRFRSALARIARDNLPFGLLMIDMDQLKKINDLHGHQAGDAVLIEFANRLKKTTRTTDTAARIGGDEFGVILCPIHNLEGVRMAVERISAEISLPFTYEDQMYALSASIGAVGIPEEGTEPNLLLELADQRMYALKQLHKSTRH